MRFPPFTGYEGLLLILHESLNIIDQYGKYPTVKEEENIKKETEIFFLFFSLSHVFYR